MQHIIEGFLSFQKEIFPQRKELFRSLASSQNPKALFISCSDSRLVPELVTQQEPGQLFVIRNAGNIVPPFGPEPGGVSATIEYAVVALGRRTLRQQFQLRHAAQLDRSRERALQELGLLAAIAQAAAENVGKAQL